MFWCGTSLSALLFVFAYADPHGPDSSRVPSTDPKPHTCRPRGILPSLAKKPLSNAYAARLTAWARFWWRCNCELQLSFQSSGLLLPAPAPPPPPAVNHDYWSFGFPCFSSLARAVHCANQSPGLTWGYLSWPEPHLGRHRTLSDRETTYRLQKKRAGNGKKGKGRARRAYMELVTPCCFDVVCGNSTSYSEQGRRTVRAGLKGGTDECSKGKKSEGVANEREKFPRRQARRNRDSYAVSETVPRAWCVYALLAQGEPAETGAGTQLSRRSGWLVVQSMRSAKVHL